MKIHKTIGALGVGNMGAAILEGLLAKKIVTSGSLWVYDKLTEKAKEFSQKWKTHQARTVLEIGENAQIILLAFKPQDLLEAASEIRSKLTKNHLVISILAGTPIAKIRKILGEGFSVVRAMPNLGAKVGEAVTALTGSDAQSLEIAEQIFSGCGVTLRLEEKHFDLVTALSGSGPAYFFLLMELMAEEGVRQGLTREAATQLAVQTAVGAGLLAKSSPDSPAELRKKVTSKGGTTEAALKVFEEKKLSDIVTQALGAALARGKELSQ